MILLFADQEEVESSSKSKSHSNHGAGCKCSIREARASQLIPSVRRVCVQGDRRWVALVNGKEVYFLKGSMDNGDHTYLFKSSALRAAKRQAASGSPRYVYKELRYLKPWF